MFHILELRSLSCFSYFLFGQSKLFLLKWLFRIFMPPVAIVIYSASLSCWSFSFFRSSNVFLVIVPSAPNTIGITSPSVHCTYCNSSSTRRWYFCIFSDLLLSRYSSDVSYGSVTSMMVALSPSTIVISVLWSSVPLPHNRSLQTLACGCILTSSFKIFFTRWSCRFVITSLL